MMEDLKARVENSNHDSSSLRAQLESSQQNIGFLTETKQQLLSKIVDKDKQIDSLNGDLLALKRRLEVHQ